MRNQTTILIHSPSCWFRTLVTRSNMSRIYTVSANDSIKLYPEYIKISLNFWRRTHLPPPWLSFQPCRRRRPGRIGWIVQNREINETPLRRVSWAWPIFHQFNGHWSNIVIVVVEIEGSWWVFLGVWWDARYDGVEKKLIHIYRARVLTSSAQSLIRRLS